MNEAIPVTHAHYYLSKGEEPRGCLVLHDDAGAVQYLFGDGSVLEVQPDDAPVAVTGDPLYPEGWQTFVTVQGQWQTWTYHPERQGWTGTVQVTVPREDVWPMAPRDWDEPDAVVSGGHDDTDICYINVAQGPDGFYLTVSLDCNSARFTDTLTQDEGPYESREAAIIAGCDVAIEWFTENNIPYEGQEIEDE